MAGSAGSIAQFFPDIFGGGAAMSGAGSAATTTAATGAGSMALGPWMAASAGIQALAGLGGGFMAQKSEDKAIEEAGKNLSRNWGYDTFLRDREKAKEMEALREGYAFMQSPYFQQKEEQDFAKNFMLSGKFSPYLTGMASRFI
jgi:hypothetical protein